MARSLASATPAFSNYGDGIHPVSKGGFGSNTIEGIKSVSEATTVFSKINEHLG